MSIPFINELRILMLAHKAEKTKTERLLTKNTWKEQVVLCPMQITESQNM